MMSIVFFAGLPRSSTVGFADLFFQRIELKSRLPLMTGHLHLAAALTGNDLGQFDSPLHLYKAQEALIRCLLKVHGMSFSLESYVSVLRYYSSSISGQVDRKRLQNVIEDPNLIIIDPSFSHSLYPDYLEELDEIVVDLFLIVVWRNPISFCLDIMQGVFAFDCCLHWILAKPNLSFPLDPLVLWLEFVRSFLQISSRLPSSFRQVYYLNAESIDRCQFAEMASEFPCSTVSMSRLSALKNINTLIADCPFSGDPSYFFKDHSDSSMLISLDQLKRFSANHSVIEEVVSLSRSIGYTLVE